MPRPTRREARIAREIDRELEQQAKSARFRERVAEEEARLVVNPPDRAPRAGADPGSIFQMPMTWTDAKADRVDDWSWGPREWGDVAWDNTILPKLREWERLLWREIDRLNSGAGHKMHHDMPAVTICNEAQDRLLHLDQYADDIFRFRLGNRRRLWGFRIVNEFQILWYDPEHNIYPTEPD